MCHSLRQEVERGARVRMTQRNKHARQATESFPIAVSWVVEFLACAEGFCAPATSISSDYTRTHRSVATP